jgi:phosphatidylinositol-3,4,5-trisphosphate 3-phosphatase/dual-specificity protein phosphatase PTEN
MVSAVKQIKTKKTYFRQHFQDDDYDLDVTYITEKVLVMGNPYNNDSLSELRRFLTSRHGGHHRIYNLASEEDFNVEVDLDNVENFPFPSNNPCGINVLIKFCSTIDVYLNLRPENVVVIHCRTGNPLL